MHGSCATRGFISHNEGMTNESRSKDPFIAEFQHLCRTDPQHREELLKCRQFLMKPDPHANLILKKRCAVLLSCMHPEATRSGIALNYYTNSVMVSRWITVFLEGGFEAVMDLRFKQRVPSMRDPNSETEAFFSTLLQIPPCTMDSSLTTYHGLSLKLKNYSQWTPALIAQVMACTDKSIKRIVKCRKIDLTKLQTFWPLQYLQYTPDKLCAYHPVYTEYPYKEDEVVLCCDPRIYLPVMENEVKSTSRGRWTFLLPRVISMQAALDAAGTLYYYLYNHKKQVTLVQFLMWLVDTHPQLQDKNLNMILSYEQALELHAYISGTPDEEWTRDYEPKFNFLLAPEQLPDFKL